ncbi:MAG: hypothetical protein KGL39_12395 [Patescibacteria group bacterium]|nr:hypothetical protein [Patescibacteria group bacterium]
MDDDELWRRLQQLPKGTFAAFLELCRVSRDTGKPLKARIKSVSLPVRERLSEGFRLIDEGKVTFRRVRQQKFGARKVVPVFKPEEPVAPKQSLPYLQTLKGASHGHPHLSLSPLPSRIRF